MLKKPNKIAALVFLLFLFSNTYPQNQTIDSLELESKTQRGKQKVETLLKLSALYVHTDIEKSVTCSNEAYQLVEEFGLPELYSAVYNSLALINFYKSEYKIIAENASKALKYAQKYNNNDQKAVAYKYLGIVNQLFSNYDTALIYFEKENELQNLAKNESGLALNHTNIGTVYQIKGNYQAALEHYLVAETLYLELSEKAKLAKIYGNVGSLYVEQQNYANAELYLSKAERVNLDNHNYIDAARNSNAMGLMLKKQKKYPNALEKFEQGITYLRSSPSKQIECAIYSNMGLVYTETANHQTAITYFEKSKNLATEIGLKTSVAAAYHNLGDSYFGLGEYLRAKDNFLNAQSIFEEIKSFPEILQTYKALASTFKMLKKSDMALSYYEKFTFLNDSLNERKRSFSLDSLQTVFDIKYLKNENLVLEKDAQLKQITIDNQRLTILSALIILLLSTIFIALLFRNSSKMKKLIKELSDKNEEIVQKSEELRQKNDKLIELTEFKEGMMQMIVHDLKNPLNILLNIRLYEPTKQIEKTETSAQFMLNLVQDILDVYKYEKSKMNLTFNPISVAELVDTAIKETKLFAENKNIPIEKNVSDQFGVTCDSNIIHRVITNFLINAIKYSPPTSVVQIAVFPSTVNPDEIEFSITNQTHEVLPEYLDRIFDKFIQYGKNKKQYSSGLGLAFCKLAIESHDKKIRVSTEQDYITFTFGLTRTPHFETAKSQLTAKRQVVFELSESEQTAIQPYLTQLLDIPLYKISAVNAILDEMRLYDHTGQIIRLCSDIFEAASKGDQEKLQSIIRQVSKNT